VKLPSPARLAERGADPRFHGVHARKMGLEMDGAEFVVPADIQVRFTVSD
jgi:hypothetical protein